MKALTIHQPFAHLIITGKKWVENRSWQTAYRGPLAIHAGMAPLPQFVPQHIRYPLGVVLGTVRLEEIIHIDLLQQMPLDHQLPSIGRTVGEILAHEHTHGPYCWLLDDVNPYRAPIAARGRQGLWNWDNPLTAVELKLD